MRRDFLRDWQDGYTKNIHVGGKEGVWGDSHVDFAGFGKNVEWECVDLPFL